MKSSNLTLLVAGTVFLAALTIYNFSLKAEYLRADFKDPFYGYSKLAFKNFDKIDIKAGNLLGVKIIKGDKFDVRVDDDIKDDLSIIQNGGTLSIAVKDTTQRAYYYLQGLTIFCPTLRELRVDAQKTVFHDRENRRVIEYQKQDDQRILMEMFSLDSLTIVQGINNTVKLNRNRIGMLKALTGREGMWGSKLIIEGDNVIKSADISIFNGNHLALKVAQIEDLNLNPSDSSSVELHGRALKLLKN